MSERQGVEIDYCPECRGVWLDRGELDKILERAQAESNEPALPLNDTRQREERSWADERGGYRGRDDRRQGARGQQYRKKSPFEFLGEIFE